MLPSFLRFSANRAGFSLIEIVLAIGIISFALVGILGMFPVALDAAANSQHETQAALIARSIFDQLEVSPNAKSRTIVRADTYTGKNPSSVTVDLTNSNNANPAARIDFDSSGKALSTTGNPSAPYTAEISVFPITVPAYGLSRVVVSVKPGASKIGYPFSSIIRQ